MATKNDKYPFVEQSFTTSENQNYNLNLNQSGKCPILVPVQFYSKPNNDEYFVSDNYEEREKLQSWDNKASSFTTLIEGNDDLKKRWKNENTLKTTNKSTLSLHIAAYENSIEAAVSDLFVNENNEGLKKEKFGSIKKRCFINSLKSRNPFEFARQKNGDQRYEPEVMQYKSSQQLLGSNRPSSSQQIGHNDGNIVRPQMSADRSMAQLAKVD
uniref:Uncharacterized protein n=1 Tax=Panagrolaimus sp. PS1159 TaxID=55785 RepID=A0AC35G0K9_9BILA